MSQNKIAVVERLNEQSKPLVSRLRAEGATPEIVDELVNIYKELAWVKAYKWAYANNAWMKEELYCTALYEIYLGIIKAADQLVDDNLSYYLAHRLNRQLMKAKYKILNPTQSWESAHKKDGRVNWSFKRHDFDERMCVKFDEPEENLYETIVSLCTTPRERTIVQMLREYYTHEEIAGSLSISRAAVYEVQATIRERYADYVRQDTSEAVEQDDDRLIGQVVTSDGGGSVHAPSETGSTPVSILAEY